MKRDELEELKNLADFGIVVSKIAEIGYTLKNDKTNAERANKFSNFVKSGKELLETL